MQYKNGALIFAPTDLSRWLNSPYASWMARYAIEQPECSPAKDQADSMLELLAKKGLVHEDAQENKFREQGKEVVNAASSYKADLKASIIQPDVDEVEYTVSLLTRGVDVVAQATLAKGSFRGVADFLVKVPGESALGDFHYEVWDTKLARRVKPGMVLQLCCYVDMLESIQKRKAENLVVALGNDTNERVPLVHCYDYYKSVKKAFLNDQLNWSSSHEPDAADFTNHGNWSEYAAHSLEERDHLSRVARITRNQINKLERQGVDTLNALASSQSLKVAGIQPEKMEWLAHQAKLQQESKDLEVPAYTLRNSNPIPDTGLSALPEPSTLDVFFDIEGFPLEGDGLEYLWGCTYIDENGSKAFRDWWAHDTKAERVAFEGFIDWVHTRWKEDPSMHVYHYAPYEVTACKRLMSTNGTREQELDDLLRNNVFVDLYAIVVHGIQIGEPRYSIKNVEKLYRSKRDTDVASGGDSVVVYDQWREALANGEESDDWQHSEVLRNIRDYNKDDCDSTLELYQWLLSKRPVSRNTRHAVEVESEETELSDEVLEAQALRDRLLLKSMDPTENENNQLLCETLAGVLDFHRREKKATWWEYFNLMDPANDQLSEDAACLADCVRSEREPFKHKKGVKNLSYEYRFDPTQKSKGIAKTVSLKGAELVDGKAPNATVIEECSDLETGLIVLQCREEPPAILSLVPNESIGAKPIPAAILRVVSAIESGETTESALLDFLHRKPPRIIGNTPGPIVQSEGSLLQDTINAVRKLDSSCLVIQGPPGAGKSYTGARIIAALMEDGKRVGIASNSHEAINNLLLGAARYCDNEDIPAKFICAKSTNQELEQLGVEICKNKDISGELEDAIVVGTTAWGFAREDLYKAFDVLMIDEAGQVALANLIAMSQATCNLVLMGDQRQLGQPTKGTHPAESGLSALDYNLGDTAAVDPEHGVFLGTTYRMHPLVNKLISKHVYNSQLIAADVTLTRTLELVGDGNPLDKDAGIVFLPVDHEDRSQYSEEEVAAIVSAAHSLIGRTLKTEEGLDKPVSLSDMLFVAPYNAQVKQLQSALGDQARVGSVDRFQGQEAPIVFLSLCSSDATLSPRGLSFLFDRNRINVAVSRAQTLCVVVGNPKLAVTSVSNLEDLKRVNFVAALMGGV